MTAGNAHKMTMSTAPSPDNHIILRQMQEIRRNQVEAQERDARIIELLGRMNARMDEVMTRVDSRLGEVRSDLVLLENRILTATTEVRSISVRLDDAQHAANDVDPVA